MDTNINLIVSATVLAIFSGISGVIRPFKSKVKNYQELILIFNLHGLCVISLHKYDHIVVNIIIIMAAVQFIFIITYHIITYMFGGVIRNKIQLSINTLMGWLSTPQSRLQYQLDNIHDDIPEDTYCEYREPLVGQDF